MSIRLHALGFAAEWTPEAAHRLLDLAELKGRPVDAAGGNYRVWRSLAGAELWFHYPWPPLPQGQPRPKQLALRLKELADGSQPPRGITAITPFHSGLSDCRIRVGRILTFDRVNPLEGSCLAWLPPREKTGRDQVIVLELVPFGRHLPHQPPFWTNAQILCCAHAVWAFPDRAAYEAGTPDNRSIRFGAYAPTTEAEVPEVALSYRYSPVTLGLATGIVERSIRHVNPVTGEPYYWLLLATERGKFDVVVASDCVTGDISEGHVAQVCGSFLARMIDATV